jgi:hypothetical protein
MTDLPTKTPHQAEWYLSICPETGRRFLCEKGRDDNIAELFATKRQEDLITSIPAMFAALELCEEVLSDLVRMDETVQNVGVLWDRLVVVAGSSG